MTLSRPTISLSATSRSKGCGGGSSFFFDGAAATPLDGLGLSGGGLFFAGFSAAGFSGGGGGGRLAFLQRSVHWLGLAKIACVGNDGPVQQNVEALSLSNSRVSRPEDRVADLAAEVALAAAPLAVA